MMYTSIYICVHEAKVYLYICVYVFILFNLIILHVQYYWESSRVVLVVYYNCLKLLVAKYIDSLAKMF